MERYKFGKIDIVSNKYKIKILDFANLVEIHDGTISCTANEPIVVKKWMTPRLKGEGMGYPWNHSFCSAKEKVPLKYAKIAKFCPKDVAFSLCFW